MDSFDSVSVLLEPPNPNPDGRMIRMKAHEFLNLMSGYQISQVGKVEKATVNTAPMKRSGIALPFQRTSATPGVPTASSKPFSQKGTKISSDVREEKGEFSSGIKKVRNCKQTNESSSLNEFQNGVKHLYLNLKNLKNLVRTIYDKQPTKLVKFTGRYLDHIAQLTEKLQTEDPSTVIARGILEIPAEFADSPFWILTKKPYEKLPKGACDMSENDENPPERSKSVSKESVTGIASNKSTSSDEVRRSSVKRHHLEAERKKSKPSKQLKSVACRDRTPPPARRSKSHSKSMHRTPHSCKSPKRRAGSPSSSSRRSRSPLKKSKSLKRRLSLKSHDESCTKAQKRHGGDKDTSASKPSRHYEGFPFASRSPEEQRPMESSRKKSPLRRTNPSQRRDPRLHRPQSVMGHKQSDALTKDLTPSQKDIDCQQKDIDHPDASRPSVPDANLKCSRSLESVICHKRPDAGAKDLTPSQKDIDCRQKEVDRPNASRPSVPNTNLKCSRSLEPVTCHKRPDALTKDLTPSQKDIDRRQKDVDRPNALRPSVPDTNLKCSRSFESVTCHKRPNALTKNLAPSQKDIDCRQKDVDRPNASRPSVPDANLKCSKSFESVMCHKRSDAIAKDLALSQKDIDCRHKDVDHPNASTSSFPNKNLKCSKSFESVGCHKRPDALTKDLALSQKDIDCRQKNIDHPNASRPSFLKKNLKFSKSFESVACHKRPEAITKDLTPSQKDIDWRQNDIDRPNASRPSILNTNLKCSDTNLRTKSDAKSCDLREKPQIQKEKDLKSCNPVDKSFLESPNFLNSRRLERKMTGDSGESLQIQTDMSITQQQAAKARLSTSAEIVRIPAKPHTIDSLNVKKATRIAEPNLCATVTMQSKQDGQSQKPVAGSERRQRTTIVAFLTGGKKDEMQSTNLRGVSEDQQQQNPYLPMISRTQSASQSSEKRNLPLIPQISSASNYKDSKKVSGIRRVETNKSQQFAEKESQSPKSDVVGKSQEMSGLQSALLTKTSVLKTGEASKQRVNVAQHQQTSLPKPQMSPIDGIKKVVAAVENLRNSQENALSPSTPTVGSLSKSVEENSTASPEWLELSATENEMYDPSKPTFSSPEVRDRESPKKLPSPAKVYPKASSLMSPPLTRDSEQSERSDEAKNSTSSSADNDKKPMDTEPRGMIKILHAPAKSVCTSAKVQAENSADSSTKKSPQGSSVHSIPATVQRSSKQSPSSAKPWQGPNERRENNNFSRISTQITQRNDYWRYNEFPYAHRIGEGMVNCRSTPNYYPPRLQYPNPNPRRQYGGFGSPYLGNQFYDNYHRY